MRAAAENQGERTRRGWTFYTSYSTRDLTEYNSEFESGIWKGIDANPYGGLCRSDIIALRNCTEPRFSFPLNIDDRPTRVREKNDNFERRRMYVRDIDGYFLIFMSPVCIYSCNMHSCIYNLLLDYYTLSHEYFLPFPLLRFSIHYIYWSINFYFNPW